MAAAGDWFVSPHAVRRFRERIAPLPDRLALAAIIHGMERAGPLRRSVNGPGLYCRVRSGNGYPHDFRAVVMPGDGPLPCVVTVLCSGRGRGGRKK